MSAPSLPSSALRWLLGSSAVVVILQTMGCGNSSSTNRTQSGSANPSVREPVATPTGGRFCKEGSNTCWDLDFQGMKANAVLPSGSASPTPFVLSKATGDIDFTAEAYAGNVEFVVLDADTVGVRHSGNSGGEFKPFKRRAEKP